MANQRTKEAIIVAFNTLLEKYTFEKITVELITQECQIAKSTFYRYFLDKYDVMNYAYKSFIDTYVDLTICNSYKEMFVHLFTYMKDNSVRMNNSFKASGVNSFESFIYEYSYRTGEIITKQNRNGEGYTPEEAFKCSIFCHGVGSILREYAEGCYDISPEEAAQGLYDVMPSTLRDYWILYDLNKI